MKKITLLLLLLSTSALIVNAQDIIKGLPYSISLVAKSSKQPTVRLKDGSGITLRYTAEAGFTVMMGKNGKSFEFTDPMPNAKFVQAAEVDIDKDGKMEVVIASRTSSETIEIKVFKKPEFEIFYKEWSSFTGVTSVEFPGDGTFKLYDKEGNAGTYKFDEEGKIAEVSK